MHPTPLTLNEYVDGDIAPAERARLDRHLSECEACRALVADLTDLTRAAAALGSVDPPPRVWARIAQLRRDEPLDPWTFRSASWPLATAAALLLATVLGLRLVPSRALVRDLPLVEAPTAVAGGEQAAPPDDQEFQRAESDYQNAIRDLEQVEAAASDGLDPQTADAFHANLAVIDAAIGESRVALAAEPRSEVAQQSLLEGLKTKVSLLETTTGLISATGRNRS
jgi:hypothetical protein